MAFPGVGQGGGNLSHPNMPGWYVVALSNGDIGAVYGSQKGGWIWGAINPPAAVTAYHYMGPHMLSGIAPSPVPGAIALGATQAQIATLAHAADSGGLGTKGQPVLVAPNGSTVSGSAPVANTSDAQATNPLPDIPGLSPGAPGIDLSGITGFFSWLSDPHTWLRFAEGLVALIIGFLAVKQFMRAAQ